MTVASKFAATYTLSVMGDKPSENLHFCKNFYSEPVDWVIMVLYMQFFKKMPLLAYSFLMEGAVAFRERAFQERSQA